MVREINKNEFNELTKNDLVIVDCFAPWCGPCKMLSPIIDELAETRSDATFYKLNVDNNEEIAIKYGIMSIPTILIFKNGELINKLVGFRSKDELEGLIK